jgi:alkaline phosphatase D
MPACSRRDLLRTGLGACAAVLPGPRSTAAGPDWFALGVASGDPLPDGVVLWTRLTPPDPKQRLQVEWRVAADEKMSRVVKRGTVAALPESAHTVHADVRGLEPARWYWYQFRTGSTSSPIGRTRTAPAAGAAVDRLSFAFVSCQHWEQGYFTAYRHLCDEDIGLVIHLGDYIYEDGGLPGRVRRHTGDEIQTLEDYRNRYALYRSDPDLRDAHARFPWIVTWDDHEVDNNYAGDIQERGAPREEFLRRRAAAYQAYYEHMPLRAAAAPKGPDMRLYRRVRFGTLAEFFVLDTRQHRTDQPCGDGNKPRCPEALNPAATMLGAAQEQWLLAGLEETRVKWSVLAQQVMMAEVDRRPGPEELYPMDQWAGYPAARDRLVQFLSRMRASNPVVLTGDIHTNWVADLKTDFRDPKSAVAASEFVGTSISSGGDGADSRPDAAAVAAENPHVKFFNAQRGYVRCLVTPGRWQADFRVMSHVTRPGGAISTRASFVLENGRRGVQRL